MLSEAGLSLFLGAAEPCPLWAFKPFLPSQTVLRGLRSVHAKELTDGNTLRISEAQTSYGWTETVASEISQRSSDLIVGS